MAEFIFSNLKPLPVVYLFSNFEIFKLFKSKKKFCDFANVFFLECIITDTFGVISTNMAIFLYNFIPFEQASKK